MLTHEAANPVQADLGKAVVVMESRLHDLSAAVALLVARMPGAEPLGVITLVGALEHLKLQIQAEALWLSTNMMRYLHWTNREMDLRALAGHLTPSEQETIAKISQTKRGVYDGECA